MKRSSAGRGGEKLVKRKERSSGRKTLFSFSRRMAFDHRSKYPRCAFSIANFELKIGGSFFSSSCANSDDEAFLFKGNVIPSID